MVNLFSPSSFLGFPPHDPQMRSCGLTHSNFSLFVASGSSTYKDLIASFQFPFFRPHVIEHSPGPNLPFPGVDLAS